jgi:hypothetical protein
MKQVPVGDTFALVDDEDFELVSQYSWHVKKNRRGDVTYAHHSLNPGNLLMHCLIMGDTGIDHKDGNGLNNTRDNLRKVTASQNAANRVSHANTSSKYKGVCWHKRQGKWIGTINKEGKRTHLGYFTDEVEAAKAYDKAAIELYGEFARLNFPDLQMIGK